MKLSHAIFILLMSVSSSAFAGPYTDKMGVCLVESTSTQDKTLLLRWIFAAMASHPDVKDLSNVSSEQAAKLNKDASALMVDLITVRCEKETREALDNEGETALRVSFEILGRVAMQGLMSNEHVNKFMEGLSENVDPKAFDKLMDKSEKKK
ncbi:MAG: hypothetical protein ACREO1_15330 [Arenimonas sp.]